MLLDEVLPDYQFREAHALDVHAAGADVFAALREIRPSELPIMRFLIGIRKWPAAAAGRLPRFGGDGDTLLEHALQGGFVIAAEDADRELVLGLVGQPWRILRGGPTRLAGSAEDFGRHREPGLAKMATNFSVEVYRVTAGTTRLRTETRIWLPDAGTTWRFGLYWAVIRPWSGLIRREWLRLIKRKAEAAR